KSALGKFTQQIREATGAKGEFNAKQLVVDFGGEDGEKLRKQMERRLELSKKEGVEKAKLQALYDAEDAGTADYGAIKKLQDMAAQIYENEQAKKEGIKTAKEAASAALKEATEAEKLKQKITDVANATKVAELETKGLAREAAILEAVQKLGSKATKAQIAEITELAGKEFDLKQKIQDRKDAFSQNPEAKANQEYKLSLEQLERQLQGNLVTEEDYHRRRLELAGEYSKKIAEANANKTVSPQDNLKAQVDPIQALANEHAQKLALIKEYENQKVLTEQQSLELMNAANTQYEQERLNAQWEIWRNQSQANQFLADGLDALGQRSTNVLTGLLTGTQSLNDAFRNVALTIVDQAVGALVQMGMQQVKNMVTESAMRKASNAQAIAEATTTGAAITNAMAPAAATTSIATMGSAATWGMAAMATAIPAMIALAGARKNGGPVNAGSMYRVGEGGKPEIFKASNGSQYMIPGDNGRVISNRQMGKGGNGVSMGDMHFTFQVQAPNGITQKEAQQIQQMVRGTVYDVLGNEMRSGGALEKVRSW
ncbi:tape measure protein, partial [Proteus sp. G2661]|nr:tape measure protein [Proteus sp. G2661]